MDEHKRWEKQQLLVAEEEVYWTSSVQEALRHEHRNEKHEGPNAHDAA